jgi:hypothetical protein
MIMDSASYCGRIEIVEEVVEVVVASGVEVGAVEGSVMGSLAGRRPRKPTHTSCSEREALQKR